MEKENNIKDKMLNQNSYNKLSEFYYIFSDSTRLKIINTLIEDSLCVSDIAEILDVSISTISHQLSILKSHDIVTTSRQGKYIVYSISDDHIKSLFETGLEHICEKNSSVLSDYNNKKSI